MITCIVCGQVFAPGKIPCKAKSLDVRADGKVVLELEATCPKCGGPIIVSWVLWCRMKEEK